MAKYSMFTAKSKERKEKDIQYLINSLCLQSYLCWLMQKEAVYGLTELSRPEIESARLVANPGCYPTSIQLPLIPLLKVDFTYLIPSLIIYILIFYSKTHKLHNRNTDYPLSFMWSQADLIQVKNIIIDSKSGVSGAG